MRVDKYLWCVRLFKTRSKATEACQKGRIKVNDEEVKPSRELKEHDVIGLRENPIWRTFRVIDFPKSRVGAKLVDDFMLELTSDDDLKELETVRRMNSKNREAGIVGRPTKKNRRAIDRFKSN